MTFTHLKIDEWSKTPILGIWWLKCFFLISKINLHFRYKQYESIHSPKMMPLNSSNFI